MNLEIKEGSLLDCKEKYICHQVNSVSKSAGGLAFSLFQKFPYSDIYTNRLRNDVPGNIIIKGNGVDQRFVINMVGQYYPGISTANSVLDNFENRERYFKLCLDKISKINNLESIAFPYFIGCGLAGGDWNNYLAMLETFANNVYKSQNTIVKLYKLD